MQIDDLEEAGTACAGTVSWARTACKDTPNTRVAAPKIRFFMVVRFLTVNLGGSEIPSPASSVGE